MVIPWRDRPELVEALRASRDRLAGAEVIVASCGGDPGALEALLAELRWPQLRAVRVESPRFNKCLALNRGAAAARGEALFLLDADVVVGPRFLRVARPLLDRRAFVSVARVSESDPVQAWPESRLRTYRSVTELVTADGRRARLVTNERDIHSGCRSGPGLVLLRRADFLAIGGMQSALEGWGWEDIDLAARLQLGLGLRWLRRGSAIHLSHGDERRALGGESRAFSEGRNLQRSLQRYAAGQWQGSLASDRARWDRAEAG